MTKPTFRWDLPAHRHLLEPKLSFHPERPQDSHVHPLKGLLEFGPYSRNINFVISDPIRIATIVPFGMSKRLDMLLNQMEQRHIPLERKDYLEEYIGFSRIFGTRIVKASGNHQHIEIPLSFDKELTDSPKPSVLLAEKLTQAISVLQTNRSLWDVLVVVLPDKWQNGFYGDQFEDFDLHDYLKAVTASRGIPSQILQENRAFSYRCRASVAWRLGIALYCKAGGVPWKLAEVEPEVAFVGISYAVRKNQSGGINFVTCCSQVFDADGTGLEFIAYDTNDDDVRWEGDNPFLNRTQMLRVISRSLRLYQQRHTGRIPKHIIIHKSTEFKKEEVEGCFDALRVSDSVDLIQVQQDVVWRGIHTDPSFKEKNKPTPGSYPCMRGSYVQLGGRDVLLWTQGDAPSVVGGRHYYKEGKGIPCPLLLSRFAGHGNWDESCRNILGLTKMDWNNDSLYDRSPVTLSYAHTLANVIKRMPSLSPYPYQFRMFM